MSKKITHGSGSGGLTKARLIDDDFGMQFPLPAADPSWLNEPGKVPAARGEIEQWTRAFNDSIATLQRTQGSAEATAGELMHTAGTYVRLFRGHSAWETLGFTTFERFCEEHLGITDRHALRLVFFAAITTREQSSLGLRKCLAGFALARVLGVADLTALLAGGKDGREPAAWAQRLGEPLGFQKSSATRLERLLKAAVKPALPEPAGPRISSVVEARESVIARVRDRFPVLETLEVESYAHSGEARVRHSASSTTDQFAALAAMYSALKKG